MAASHQESVDHLRDVKDPIYIDWVDDNRLERGVITLLFIFGMFSLLVLALTLWGGKGAWESALWFYLVVGIFIFLSFLFLSPAIVHSRQPASKRVPKKKSIELHGDCVREYEEGKLINEINFDSTVETGIYFKHTIRDPAYGSLNGYYFKKGRIRIDLWIGLRRRDVVSFWEPFISVVKTHGMQMSEGLESYLGWRDKKGLGG